MNRIRVATAAVLAAWVTCLVACSGGAGGVDPKTALVGTWTREHEGKLVQEITFTTDGKYDSMNPTTGGTKESGTYSTATDGKSVTFTAPTVTYTHHVAFNGKNEYTQWKQVGNTKVLELTFRRKK